jgi:elongation factor Ts
MAEVSAELVKKLREQTGAGMMDCKAALKEAAGDMNGAIEVLRKKGLKDVGKRAGKTAAEGTIGVYIHAGGQVVAIVELNCETDFVARGDEFQEAAKSIALHVAAMKPKFITREAVPASLIEKEKEIALEQLTDAQKKNADKILEGKVSKFFEEVCLLDQPFVRDDSGKLTIKQMIDNLSVKCGEKVQVRRFERFEVGEGIEKVQANLAEEVAATLSAA